ncbi:MAG TPA: uroporphyrinogen-III C-methyltransferase [Vicinamibacterales bacterium]|nr:uroporphyrinogen-III C-methyltransferase [Vicinamibacterales bacterium]
MIKVFIVGAGPGDPGLLTVRGRRCLEHADVVVHDHRVHARLLRIARPEAEKIDVGAAAPRPLDQDAISLLLVEKAREGKLVVRLKWGDPFVFDSGGREALFLHEHGVPFEIVPGVPAAIGASAYAGVPVTYPGAGDVLTLVRGHESESDTPPLVDWARLAGVAGTIACYAGARQVGTIAEALVAHGRDRTEAAALVYAGTTASQITLAGTLEDIASRARADEPALLVVGPVAALREHLRWYDDRPLFGRRIVVTRSREQAGEFTELLEERGAQAILAPTIRIAPPEDPEALDRAAASAGSHDWIVFTSVNAVDHFLRRVLEHGDIRDLKGVRLCAIGPSTAERIARFGIRVDAMPEEHRADAIVDALAAAGGVKGQRVLLPHADIARERLADDLREAGAEVTEVAAYRTLVGDAERDGDHDVYRMLLDRHIDAVTFTSASSVRNFAQIFGADQAADLLRSTVVASIGPVTAEAAQQLGIETTVMPARYTVADLVDALVDHFTQPKPAQEPA